MKFLLFSYDEESKHFNGRRRCKYISFSTATRDEHLGKEERKKSKGYLKYIQQGYVAKESRSVVSDFVTPWTLAYQAPLSMGFSRQRYWSGLPFPSLNTAK